MNGRILEIEPGTIGYEQVDSAGVLRALNAWAKRRGIVWESPFRRNFEAPPKKKMKRTP